MGISLQYNNLGSQKVIKKNIAKTALIVALMLGNVSENVSQSGYYEDDSDFNEVSSLLSHGWGWSLNKAYGNENCRDKSNESERRECEEKDGWDPDYTGGVFGDPWVDDSFGIGDYSGGDPYGDTGGATRGDQGGGPGAGDQQAAQKSAEEKRAISYTVCLLDAASLYKPCVTDATAWLNDLKFVCDMESMAVGWFNKWAGSLAMTACYMAYRHDLGDVGKGCRADVDEAQESCA